GGSVLLVATPRQQPRLEKLVESWTLDSVLAVLQILTEARGRLRGGVHGRLLVESALVRVARLENMVELSELVARLSALDVGAPAHNPGPVVPAERKATARPETSVSPAPEPAESESEPLTLEDVRRVWSVLIKKLGVRLGVPLNQAANFLAISGPNTLAVQLPAGYNGSALACDTPEAREKIESALETLLHRPIAWKFEHATA